jgi:serine/threonine protein kinase
MPLLAGTRLGPYEIVSAAGAGGMGEVYRARDTRLERRVAIKVLPGRLSSDPERRDRMQREARAISSLQHPNICALYDVGSQDGTDYLVMEYLEGETLAQRLRRGPLPLAQALKVGIEVASALDKAHRSGIVHRDLKPGNIMLTKNGAKLMDFGLAKPAALAAGAATGTDSGTATLTAALTTDGAVVGTVPYMSPEQFEDKQADARSDIFSFGTVLYEMITGRRAFTGKSQATVVAAILGRDPEPITATHPLAPAALDHLLKLCLAKDPDERWQSAHDLAAQLKFVSSAPATGPAATRRDKLAFLAWVALVVFASAVMAGLLIWRVWPR